MKKTYSIFSIIFISLMLINTYTFAAKQNLKQVIPDTVISGKIKSKLALDPSISVFKVDVNTKNGIVTLAGQVNSDTDADALIQIAQSTDGVKDVNATNVAVKNSEQPFTDIVITAKVKGILVREKLMGHNVPVAISVETNNGTVYLSGQVETDQQAYNAIRLAKSVNGAKHVESRLQITST